MHEAYDPDALIQLLDADVGAVGGGCASSAKHRRDLLANRSCPVRLRRICVGTEAIIVSTYGFDPGE